MINDDGWSDEDFDAYSPVKSDSLNAFYSNSISSGASPLDREQLLLNFLGDVLDQNVYDNIMVREGRPVSLNYLEDLAINQLDGSAN